jgi:hypothetical protein
MNRRQMIEVDWDKEENPCTPERQENNEARSSRYLCYATKLFPVNALVRVIGRTGIYRIVSEPYIPQGYSYPHFDVEARGKRLSVNVFSAIPFCGQQPA